MPGYPKASCLEALWPGDDSGGKSLGACGLWGAGVPAHLQGGGLLVGLGESTEPASGPRSWTVSWRAGAASGGSGSALFQLSPTPLLPRKGRRSSEQVVFVLCFWAAQWHCGYWQPCQGKPGIYSYMWSVKRGFLGLWEEPGSRHIGVGRALCYTGLENPFADCGVSA